jgi:hypothetical protein
MPTPSEVYRCLLLPTGNGFPLWTPEPNERLPDAKRDKGIMIGDVGIIKADGSFDFLFNICLPSSDPINHGRVPHGFENVAAERSFETTFHRLYHAHSTTISSESIVQGRFGAGVSVQNNPSVWSICWLIHCFRNCCVEYFLAIFPFLLGEVSVLHAPPRKVQFLLCRKEARAKI